MKRFVGMTLSVVAAGVALADFTPRGQHDAAWALVQQTAAESPSNPWTDAQGVTWTFGQCSSASALAADVTPFANKVEQLGTSGLQETTAPGTLTLPFIAANKTGDDLSGAFYNVGKISQNQQFMGGEMIMHPDDPSKPVHLLAIAATVPEAGCYRIHANARSVQMDWNTSRPGVTFAVSANGVVLSSKCVSLASGPVQRDAILVPSVALPAGGTILFTVDPMTSHSFDMTVATFYFERVPSDAVSSLDIGAALMANLAAATPSNPWTTEGWTITAGGISRALDSAAPFGEFAVLGTCGYGYSLPGVRNSNPTVSYQTFGVNTNTLPFYDSDHSMLHNGYFVNPGELFMHPCDPKGQTACRTFVRAAAPSNGSYRVRARFRSTTNNGDGVTPVLAVKGTSVLGSVSTTKQATQVEVSSGRRALAAGDELTVAVDPLESTSYDSTVAEVFVDAVSSERINVDIKGWQSVGDPEPTEADVYKGPSQMGASDDVWNWVSVRDQASSVIRTKKLRRADGSKTTVTISLEAESGKTVCGDRLNELRAISLLNDYIYVTSDDALTVRIAGLTPGLEYELGIYAALYNSESVMNFAVGGKSHVVTHVDFSASKPNVILIEGVKADANGEIVGTITAPASAAILPALQIGGVFPGKRPGFVVMCR